MRNERIPASSSLGRGVLAGLAGTVVMTAFQRFVGMPLTSREDSYAPARFTEKVTSSALRTATGRRRLNETTHLALGILWGGAYGVVVCAGRVGAETGS